MLHSIGLKFMVRKKYEFAISTKLLANLLLTVVVVLTIVLSYIGMIFN